MALKTLSLLIHSTVSKVVKQYESSHFKTSYPNAPHERCILWNDPALRIEWPKGIQPILSAKDVQGRTFTEAEVFI